MFAFSENLAQGRKQIVWQSSTGPTRTVRGAAAGTRDRAPALGNGCGVGTMALILAWQVLFHRSQDERRSVLVSM